MSMTVKRVKDSRTPKVLMHKIADIRGGVSVNVSELGGDYLPEGAVLSAPVSGVCHVVKVAVVAEAVAADGVTVKVAKGHHFKAGDYVMAAEGAAAVTISAIDGSNAGYDALTIDAALGELSAGDCLAQSGVASTAGQKKSALKYAPLAVNGTGKPVRQGENLDTDAWVMAVTKGNTLPPFVADALKGVINY